MQASGVNRMADPNNLYVSGLDPAITDDVLRDLFSPYGVVVSAKVMVDVQGRSKGVGFVCFSRREEAEVAVAANRGNSVGVQFAHHKSDAQVQHEKLVKSQIKQSGFSEGAPAPQIPGYGPTSKVRPMARPSPYSRGQKQADDNIYVCGLPLDWTEESLQAYFGNFGAILSLRVMLNPQGQSKGCGFVRFERSVDAHTAIAHTNGAVLAMGAPPLQVRLANDKTAAQVAPVYVPAMQPVIDRTGVPIFNAQGEIIVPPPFPGLMPQQHAAPTLVCRPPAAPWTPSSQDNPEASLFVLHIPTFFSEDDLRPIFEECGPIASVRVMRDVKNPQINRGFAFVNMVNKEDAQKCVSQLSGRKVFNKVLQVSFKGPATKKSAGEAQE